MKRERCPTMGEWLDYTEGRLAPSEAARVEAHRVSGCAACAALRLQMDRVLQALPAADGPRLSQQSRLSLRALAAARLAPRPRPLRIAHLLAAPLTAPARGESEGVSLRYEIDDYQVRLWAEPSPPGAWYVIGQVLSRSEGAFREPEAAALFRLGDGARIDARREDTEFHLPAVAAGTYRLEIRLPESDLLLPRIALE